jgi:oxaloacetate decarboxylase alpha subunit
VSVNGRSYDVVVSAGGEIEHVQQSAAPVAKAPGAAADEVTAPMSGNIVKVLVKPGQQVAANDILIILEAMKMETEVRAPNAGTVATVEVREGDTVELGATLVTLG